MLKAAIACLQEADKLRADGDEAAAQLALLRQFVERRREALADLEVQLATLPTEPAQHAESLP